MGPKLDKLSPILKIALIRNKTECCSFLRSTVSNALDRSKGMPKVDSFLSRTEEILLLKSIEANAVEWFRFYGIQFFSIIRYYASFKIQSVGKTWLRQKV